MKKYIMIVFMLLIAWSFSACKTEQEIEVVKDVYFSVKLEDKFGAINQKGEEVIPFVYDQLSPFTKEGVALAIDENGQHLINTNNEILVSHPTIEIMEQRLEYVDYTPERPLWFRASDDTFNYIYNSSGEQIVKLDLEEDFMCIIFEDYIIYNINHKSSIVKMEVFNQGLFNQYDTIFPFIEIEGYLAKKDQIYYFLDQDLDIINTITDIEGNLNAMPNYAVVFGSTNKIYFDASGQIIGSVDGYQSYSFVLKDEYIIYINDDVLYGIDHFSGLRMADPIYDQISEREGLIYGYKSDGTSDFYDGSTYLFSKENYQATGEFIKADDDLYIITTLFSSFGHTLEVSYVNEEGQVVSDAYKNASPFNESGIAVIEESDYKDYLINRDYQKISSAYDDIEYYDDLDMFYAVNKDENDNFTVYLLDANGDVKQEIQDNGLYLVDHFLFKTRQSDQYEIEFLDVYYIDDDLSLITQEQFTYSMLRELKEIDLTSTQHLSTQAYLTTRYFEILTKDTPYTYVQELYDGYYLFTENDEFIIMTHDLVKVSLINYQEVSHMPTYRAMISIG